MNLNDLPIQQVKGIGEESGKLLGGLGIKSVQDLLEYFPFRYEDYSLQSPVEAKHEERVTFAGVVQNEPSVRYYGKKKNKLTFRIVSSDVLLTVTFFNRAFLKSKLVIGTEVTITGKWDANRLSLTGSELKFGLVEREGDVEPVYHSSGKLSSKQIQKWIAGAVAEFAGDITEPLPESIRTRYKLMGKAETIRHLHQPLKPELVKQARRRFVYEELLFFS